jgi:hypothetical protein
VRPIPQRPYTTPAFSSHPRVFFPPAREAHPDQASHELAARLLSLQQRHRVQQLQTQGQTYSLHHHQAMSNAYRMLPHPVGPHAMAHADGNTHTRDMYYHNQQQQQPPCRFEGGYMN